MGQEVPEAAEAPIVLDSIHSKDAEEASAEDGHHPDGRARRPSRRRRFPNRIESVFLGFPSERDEGTVTTHKRN